MTEEQPDTRDRLLQAAESLFAEHGYDATSIRDIATAAEVNVAAVNYHFHGKDRLYLEVLRRAIAAKRQRHRLVLEASVAAGVADLENVIRTFFRTHFEDVLCSDVGGNFLMLFVREMHHGTPEAAETIREALRPMWEDLGRVLLANLPDADPDVAQWIVGSLHGQLIHFTMRWHKSQCSGCPDGVPEAMRALFPPLADDVDQYIDRAVEHITRFSAAGIRAVAGGDQPVEETT